MRLTANQGGGRRPEGSRRGLQTGCVMVLAGLFLACSPKAALVNLAASALTGGGSSMSAEDDPDLLLDALPFGLVTLEGLARSSPKNVALREALAAGFTQYAYARADLRGELIRFEDYKGYQQLQGLARKRYARAVRWGLEGLSIRHRDFTARLASDPALAVAQTRRADLELLYWTGAAWLASISISVDNVALIAQMPQAVALLERASVLDPDYARGGLHEFMMALDMARGSALGGGLEKARAHFERALALSEGKRASVFVGYATAIAVKQQDRQAFDQMLARALAIDPAQTPEDRLSNLLSQEKARMLQAHVEDLFDSDVLEAVPEEGAESSQP